MGSFKNRSDYFKSICNNNILIADGRIIDSGGVRKSYFRLNDEDEFEAACANWVHFPCVVYYNNSFRYKSVFPGKPRKIIINELWFVAKIDHDNFPIDADAIENAYDVAMQAMDEFVSWLNHEMETNNACGEIFYFSMDQSKVERLGTLSNNLTGWSLLFQDEKPSDATAYDASKWVE